MLNGSKHASSGASTTGTAGIFGYKGCGPATLACDYDGKSIVIIGDLNGFSSTNNGESITIEGPGTLVIKHLDLGTDTVTVDTPGGAEADATYSGFHKDCIGASAVAGAVTDAALGMTGTGGTVTDAYCHDILTGKLLSPESLQIPAGNTDITFNFQLGASGSGFLLLYIYDDTYFVDLTGTDSVEVDTVVRE